MTRFIKRRTGAVAWLLMAGLLASCGSASVPESVVAAQAQWLCDVTRYAYADAEGATRRLEEILFETGVSADLYAEFEALIDTDAGVRNQVSAAYDARCGAGP